MKYKRHFAIIFVKFLGEKNYLKLKFFYRTGKMLNLKSPRTFTEKIQWLKLYHRDPIMTVMSDKVLAKNFVSERIGEEYVIDLIKVFDSIDEISLDSLPEAPFVMKMNHDSSSTKVFLTEGDIDIIEIKRFLREKWRNYFYNGIEWEYKNIVPKILIEKYIKSGDNVLLQDFKVHCFNGSPLFVQTISDRECDLKENWHTPSWEPLDISYFSGKKASVERPVILEEMLEKAEKLASNFPYVRIDFYNYNGKLLFGEFTFRPYGGFMIWNSEDVDNKLGDLLNLQYTP